MYVYIYMCVCIYIYIYVYIYNIYFTDFKKILNLFILPLI